MEFKPGDRRFLVVDDPQPQPPQRLPPYSKVALAVGQVIALRQIMFMQIELGLDNRAIQEYDVRVQKELRAGPFVNQACR